MVKRFLHYIMIRFHFTRGKAENSLQRMRAENAGFLGINVLLRKVCQNGLGCFRAHKAPMSYQSDEKERKIERKLVL